MASNSFRSNKVKEKEETAPPVKETRIIEGAEPAANFIVSVIRRAAEDTESSFLHVLLDSQGSAMASLYFGIVSQLREKNPGFRILIATDIQPENLAYVKQMIRGGMEVRHLDGNIRKLLVSRTDAIETSHIDKNGLPDGLVWSNDHQFVAQLAQVFDAFWRTAIPADQRIRQLGHGIELGETRIISDLEESTRLGWRLLEEVREEILIVLGSAQTLVRNNPMYRKMLEKPEEKGVHIRILAPLQEDSQASMLQGLEWRNVRPMTTGIAIYDRSRMLITQYENPEAVRREDAFISNIYTTNKHTIAGIVSVFEALWDESDLRQKEERNRKRAELLQDILTHDIRNYNQSALVAAELIKERSSRDPEVEKLCDIILNAIGGSTTLVDRAKKLGRILSEENPSFYPVNLLESTRTALELTSKANIDKRIKHELTVSHADPESHEIPSVVADNLLDEVFINLYSNAVKYTDGNEVSIETILEETREKEGEPRSWKISIVDHGRGIPDAEKQDVFTRYQKTARGSGLGLYISQALVVDRYRGKIRLSSRVREDYSKGTVAEVRLQGAEFLTEQGGFR